MAKYIINKRENGSYFFVLVADNGRMILRGEHYSTYLASINGIEAVKKYSTNKDNYNVDYKSGTFILKAANSQVIGKTPYLYRYNTKEGLDNAVQLAIKYAPTATIETSFDHDTQEEPVKESKKPTPNKNLHISLLEAQVAQLKIEVLTQTEIAKNNKEAFDVLNKVLFDKTMVYEELEDRYDLVVIEKESLKVEKDFIKKTLDRAVFRQIEINDELKKTKIDNLKLVDQYNKIPKLIRSIFS